MIYTVVNLDSYDHEGLELVFTTPLQMQKWTEELLAAIQTPQQQQQQLYYQHEAMETIKTNDVSRVPVLYSEAQLRTLMDRGYMS